jgi:hypothetical protein
MSNNNANITNTHGEKPPKPRWWTPFWIVNVILIISSGFILYFFVDNILVLILSEVIFLLALLVAYYIRIKPSKNVNKVVYIAFGTFSIGFGLLILYALLCGITNLGTFLMNFKPAGPWIHLSIIIGLYIIGGFIGYGIGKKRDYKLPFSL